MTKLVYPELQGILGTRLGNPLPVHTPASISTYPFHGTLSWMDGLCNGQLHGMDGNGCTDHPFPRRGYVDRGRGMDRQLDLGRGVDIAEFGVGD